MTFELDAVYVEEASRQSALARRVLAGLPPAVPVHHFAGARQAARYQLGPDPLGAGKRRLVIMRHRRPFVAACPAGSAEFACCGYLVMTLASNCPMDCSYCFLQDYVADNPGFQIYSGVEPPHPSMLGQRLAALRR